MAHNLLRRAGRKLVYQFWRLNGRYGRRVSIDSPERVTVLLTSYSVARARHHQAQVRSILKCDFVERVVVTNHNSEKRIADWVRAGDPRLTLIDQPVRRSPGYRWTVASTFDPAYVLSIDDDLLLFPQQLATLCRRLLAEPERPHGLAGLRGGAYFQSREITVDHLVQFYALTRAQVARYHELADALAARDESLAHAAEFVVLSHSGLKEPAIHDVGPILRDDSASTPGIAIHREPEFHERCLKAERVLREITGKSQRTGAGDTPLPS